MRLISYRAGGETRLGARAGDAVVDLNSVDPNVPTDIVALLEGGDAAMAAARAALEKGAGQTEHHAPADLELLPVVPRPPKIVCVARNYAEHAAEAKLDVLSEPNLFIRFAQSLHRRRRADPGPQGLQGGRLGGRARGDHRPRREATSRKADALDHVAGYAIFNDVSIRDWQIKKPPIQFGAGKNFDGSGPFGPDLVTADEIPDPGVLAIELTVNGVVKQSSTTASMIFDVPTIIEFVSTFTTLQPGDVIATGTPSGVGNFREPPEFLVAGDTVRITLEGVGVQENPVIDEPAS